MTTATNANVTKLYIATFDRAPDAAGLNYWVNQSGLSLEQIAQSFFDQPETQAKYAGVDLQTFVETIYRNVLGRDGEAAGVAYWKGELESGNITFDQAILAVIGGAQGTDATLLENKTEVGIYYAQNNSDKDAFAVIDEVQLNPESVSLTKKWIDGGLPAGATPSTYFVLDDNRAAYDLTGSAKDDVFVVEAFKSATIKGGEGSDTLDFQDYSPAGVTVNLSTGLGPVGAGGTAMKLEWIENIRGTSGNDTLVGNSDANILVSMGGTDVIDGGVGNDRILVLNVEDVAKVGASINGGQNTDTLEITNQTAISVGANTFSNVSDVEILQVGYSEEGVAAAATITVTDPAFAAPLNTFKEIKGTESYDKKGAATNDVIQSANHLDVSGVKLTSIEELKATATNTYITIGKDTLTSVKKVTGFTDGTTALELEAKAGDVFDLTVPTFEKIDRVEQVPDALGAAIATTIIVNQSLVNSLATNNDADGFSNGDFSASTLKASGIGLDLSALFDGDTNFKAIEFGTAKEVTIGNINDTGVVFNDLPALRTITGSENDSDLLRVLPDVGALVQKLSYTDAGVEKAIAITKVERLDFEEIGTVALMNGNLTDVKQVSGDDDGKYLDGTSLANGGTFIDAGNETATGGLDLKGKKLEDIVGLTNTVSTKAGTVTINTATQLGTSFKSLDVGSSQTIIADDAGSYDLSTITTAEGAEVDFDSNVDTKYDLKITYVDKFVGSAGNDIVKGGKDSFGYQLGKGDDQFIGTNEATEVVEGGEGNDTIALGDNVTDTTNVNPMANIDVLVKSFNTNTAADYAEVATTVGLSAVGNALGVSSGLGAFADGGANDDVITSGKGDDVLFGGTGNDRVEGGEGNDILAAGEGDDILSGGKGNDYMVGGAGNDLLEGNAGEDFLFGGKGKDILRGDELKSGTTTIDYLARDHFIFEAGDSGTTDATVDVIKDFLSINNATGLDLDGNGNKGGAFELERTDVIYLNWFATDDAGKIDGRLPVAVTGTLTTGLDGVSYGTNFADVGNLVTGTATSLEDAANKALDRVYTDKGLTSLAAATEYTSVGAQFEYGGKEYVVIDAYVTGAGTTANNFNAANDLLVEISDTAVTWSVSADDVVVTRWDSPVL